MCKGCRICIGRASNAASKQGSKTFIGSVVHVHGHHLGCFNKEIHVDRSQKPFAQDGDGYLCEYQYISAHRPFQREREHSSGRAFL